MMVIVIIGPAFANLLFYPFENCKMVLGDEDSKFQIPGLLYGNIEEAFWWLLICM